MTYAEVMNVVGPVIIISFIVFCFIDPLVRGTRSLIYRFVETWLAIWGRKGK